MSTASDFVPKRLNRDSLDQLAGDVEEELLRLGGILKALRIMQLNPSYTEPPKPRDGMIVYADGTQWNPGSGEGYYGYYNSTWNSLG